MHDEIVRFVVFWGVWILVPILIDGITTLTGLIGYFVFHFKNRSPLKKTTYYPRVSIIVPVYNGEKTLAMCLESIGRQSYPLDKMEVVLVNNGSTDNSFKVFNEMQRQLALQMGWYTIVGQGKAWALNAGIHMTDGEYVMGLDCDVVLDREAVRSFIEHMNAHPDIGAATGYLEILPVVADSPRNHQLLASLEFLEYATTFGVGRAYQSTLHSVYTLSGACTVYRRNVLLSTYLYNKATVSEDTDMTFQIYERAPESRVAVVPGAKIHLHAIESLSALYKQRVRWQRGQLEVSALHEKLMDKSMWRLSWFSPARTLLVDHTLSFPRFVWTFFMPILILFGYSPALIVSAYLLVYLFYLLSELLWFWAALLYADREVKTRLRQNWLLCSIMPLYRMLIFFFRFSGFLDALSEPAAWSVRDPGTQLREGWETLYGWWTKNITALRKRNRLVKK